MNNNDKINKKIDNIDTLLNTKMLHLFDKKYKMILSSKNFKELKSKVNTIEKPKKNTKVYLIRVIISEDKKSNPVTITCASHTLTPDYNLYIEDDDSSQTVTYTNEELLKYGFKMGHIQRIIKVIKNHLISFRPEPISITKIIRLFEK
jgi:hypothetical protein